MAGRVWSRSSDHGGGTRVEGCSHHGRPRSRVSLEVGKDNVFPRTCTSDLLPPFDPVS